MRIRAFLSGREGPFAKKNFWPSAVIGALLAWFALRELHIFGTNGLQGSLVIWIAWLFCAAGATACIWYALGCRSKGLVIGAGAAAGAFSLALLLGSRTQLLDPPALFQGPQDLLTWGLPALLFWPAFLCLFYAMDRSEEKAPAVLAAQPVRKMRPVFQWLLWSALFFAVWLPYFFTYYPGLMTGDSFSCLVRGMGWTSLNNQQPLFYQLWVGLWVRLGSLLGHINYGVALYSLVQMACMAGIFGYGFYWLHRRGCRAGYLFFAAAYLLLNPTFGKYAMTMWKDILFGGVMLLFALFLADTAQQRGENLLRWQGLVHLCLLGAGVAFLRNNGLYILAFVAVFLVLWCRRHWKRVLPAAAALVVACAAVQGPVFSALGIEKSPFAESLAIPLQQVSRVVAQDGAVTQEQAEFLDQLLPLEDIKESYYPYSVDQIKFHEHFDDAFLEANKGEFFKTWFSMFWNNKEDYVKAFLMETLGYWNPGLTRWVTADTITSWGNDYGITPRNLILEATGQNPKLYFDGMTLAMKDFPLTALLNNIAVTCWCAGLLLLYIVLRRQRWARILPFLPMAALWLTTMIAAPTFCEFRYMFAFFTTLPFLLPVAVPGAFLTRRPRTGTGVS